MVESLFEKLCDHARETALLTSVEATIEWDERTYLPSAAGPYRADQLAYLAGKAHERRTATELGDWLSELIESPLADDPHSDTGATIHELKRQYDRHTKLPAQLVEQLTRARANGQHIWAKARAADDFSMFQPALEEMVALKQQEAKAIGYTDHPYDALLDDYEPGAKTVEVAEVLAALRVELVPIVQAIGESGVKPPVDLLQREYPVAAQSQFGQAAAAAIGFDFSGGRVDVTDHPFCTTLGPADIRLTTRYDERFFSSAFFGTLHEAGHGMYEQGLPAEQFGLPLGDAISLGIHESQSRLWENLVGRSFEFWEHMFPSAQAAFPKALGTEGGSPVALEDFYFAMNAVEPSLIRVEADEVTYNLHIIVRFELEQALLTGDLQVADLPGAWNEKYEQTVGIAPSSDAGGCMQDVHWSAGLFGYFPTYALGNLYASQLFEQATSDIGDIKQQFRAGEFQPLCDWMRRHVHEHGKRYSAAEIAQRATGKPLSHDALIRHIKSKFGPLYGLSL